MLNFISQIESETSAAYEKSNMSLKAIELLKIRLEALKKKYIENDVNVQQAEDAARQASETAFIAETVSRCIPSFMVNSHIKIMQRVSIYCLLVA